MLRLVQGAPALWRMRRQCRGLSGAAAAVAGGWGSHHAPDIDYTEAITDLGNPAAFYPVARRLERTIIAHLGPTNSGKTHEALQHLRRSESGVYCGPLRLLAWQVHDQLCAGGLPTNLVTGQERRQVAGARHTACTTEMASTSHPVDVAVLDEIQMLGDETRGRALSRWPATLTHIW